jgi:hypothetical protein
MIEFLNAHITDELKVRGNQALNDHTYQTGSTVDGDSKQVCSHTGVAVGLAVVARPQCSCI